MLPEQLQLRFGMSVVNYFEPCDVIYDVGNKCYCFGTHHFVDFDPGRE